MIEAYVRGTGHRYATSGLEAVEVHVDRRSAIGLPFVDGQRVDVTLQFGQVRVRAGLRATPDNPFVWLCPDVIDQNGNRSTLAELFDSQGLTKNAMVTLDVDGNHLRVSAVAKRVV